MISVSSVEPRTVKQWLADASEIALIDVREAGEFASGHPLFASSISLGLFESELLRLVPRLGVRLVLMDDGVSGRALRAARMASDLGYQSVHCLEGGTKAWQANGYTLFEGQFVPSKAFGEIAEHVYRVPHVSARELASWKKNNRPVLIIDGRPFEEHRKMNIPGSVCLPNGELPYRIEQILPDESVPIVVHCAGRTRSIIGAQILRETGLKNPVFALENGTQGWTLAGLELEYGSSRLMNETPKACARLAMKTAAPTFAARWHVPLVSAHVAGAFAADQTRTTYFLDVRTKEEYRSGTVDGADHAPGGQLIQSTDTWAAVHGARIVLIDDVELRAATVGRWLQAMGWECHVLTGGPDTWDRIHVSGLTHEFDQPEEFRGRLREDHVIFDTRGSMAFRQAHIANAKWCLRANLPTLMEAQRYDADIVLCGDFERARMISADLRKTGFGNVQFLPGTPEEWSERGYEIVSTPSSPTDDDALDFVSFTHDRHSGNMDAARQYLAWETGLVDRLDADERSVFRIE